MEHIALSKEAAKEGMVLLKNEGEVLPLKKGSKVALFGKAAFDYVKGGGGSGDVTVSYTRKRQVCVRESYCGAECGGDCRYGMVQGRPLYPVCSAGMAGGDGRRSGSSGASCGRRKSLRQTGGYLCEKAVGLSFF